MVEHRKLEIFQIEESLKSFEHSGRKNRLYKFEFSVPDVSRCCFNRAHSRVARAVQKTRCNQIEAGKTEDIPEADFSRSVLSVNILREWVMQLLHTLLIKSLVCCCMWIIFDGFKRMPSGNQVPRFPSN